MGCVVDGFIRDTDFLLDLGFQAWSRGHTQRDIVGHWLPVAHEVDIRIGDVDIAPGDFLLGDRDGLVRIPRAIIEDVIALSETAMATESEVRKAIRAGTDPQEANLKYGKFWTSSRCLGYAHGSPPCAFFLREYAFARPF